MSDYKKYRNYWHFLYFWVDTKQKRDRIGQKQKRDIIEHSKELIHTLQIPDLLFVIQLLFLNTFFLL